MWKQIWMNGINAKFILPRETITSFLYGFIYNYLCKTDKSRFMISRSHHDKGTNQ